MLTNINYLYFDGTKSYVKLTYDSSNLIKELELSTPHGDIYLFKINYVGQQIKDVSISVNTVLTLKSYYDYAKSNIKIEHEIIKLYSLPNQFFTYLSNTISKSKNLNSIKELVHSLMISNTYSELIFKNDKLKAINIHSKKDDGSFIQTLKCGYSISASKTKSETSIFDVKQNQWVLISSTEISNFQKSTSPITDIGAFLITCGFGVANIFSSFYFPESSAFNDKNYQKIFMNLLGNQISEPYKNVTNANNLIERDTDLTQTTSYSRRKANYYY